MSKKSDRIICEDCDEFTAVIIYKNVYLCGECYMLDQDVDLGTAIMNLRVGFEKKRFKN